MKNSIRPALLGSEEDILTVAFEHPIHGDVGYEIILGDVSQVHSLVQIRSYTLGLIDIPYGFDRPRCLHDDEKGWGKEEISKFLQSFKHCTTAKL